MHSPAQFRGVFEVLGVGCFCFCFLGSDFGGVEVFEDKVRSRHGKCAHYCTTLNCIVQYPPLSPLFIYCLYNTAQYILPTTPFTFTLYCKKKNVDNILCIIIRANGQRAARRRRGR